MVKTNGSNDRRKSKAPQHMPTVHDTDSLHSRAWDDGGMMTIKRDPDGRRTDVVWNTSWDQPETSQPGIEKKKGGAFKCLELNEEEEEALAEWIRIHPEFYDRANRGFKGKEAKEELWMEKGRELGVDYDLVKRWYQSMRTRYGKLSEEGYKEKEHLTFRERWIIQRFGFLDGHIIRHLSNRAKDKTAKPKCNGDGTDEELNDGDDDEDRTGTPVSLQSTPGEPGTSTGGYTNHHTNHQPVVKRRKRELKQGLARYHKLTDKAGESRRLRTEMTQHLSTPVPEVSLTSKTQWGAWIASSLPEIHESLWDDFQAESFKLVTKYSRRSRQLRQQERQQNFGVHQQQPQSMSGADSQDMYPSMVPAYGSTHAVPVSVFPAASNPLHGASDLSGTGGGNMYDSDCGGSASESESDGGVTV
ncbi:Hypp2615 [Branchiostoma lanceolatum]|uniref:Hypp2615 protein n=1 Tax=Branchiostoma lanceolatum TaxID=7740 RepID=A0A8J9ZVT2_BRALA|nr:Hypp2615 [Branchiostoma lanceolatum]